MNFAEIQSRVSMRLGDVANKRHTLDLVKASINEAYEILCETTGCYETSATMSLATSRIYSIPSELFKVRFIYNTQTGFWLVPTSIGELDAGYWRWRINSGTPDRFYIQGLHKIGLYPKSDVATGTVVLYGSGQAPALSADADEPCFPEEFQDALEHYAVYDRLVDDGEVEKGLMAYGQFTQHEADLENYVNDRGWDASMIVVGDGSSNL